MISKCDIRGCKNKATIFSKHFGFCKECWFKIFGAKFE